MGAALVALAFALSFALISIQSRIEQGDWIGWWRNW